MGEEINAAKLQAWEIIHKRRGTLQEPEFYLLVPFHDPGKVGMGWTWVLFQYECSVGLTWESC